MVSSFYSITINPLFQIFACFLFLQFRFPFFSILKLKKHDIKSPLSKLHSPKTQNNPYPPNLQLFLFFFFFFLEKHQKKTKTRGLSKGLHLLRKKTTHSSFDSKGVFRFFVGKMKKRAWAPSVSCSSFFPFFF